MPWVELLPSDAVGPGEVRRVETSATDAVGLDLVVWRTGDGRPVVCDARCPHTWTHLGFEGVVDRDELVCTAHFWRFDAQGVGSKVNVLGRRDPKGDIRTYPVREEAGTVVVDLPAPTAVDP